MLRTVAALDPEITVSASYLCGLHQVTDTSALVNNTRVCALIEHRGVIILINNHYDHLCGRVEDDIVRHSYSTAIVCLNCQSEFVHRLKIKRLYQSDVGSGVRDVKLLQLVASDDGVPYLVCGEQSLGQLLVCL